MRYPTRVAAAAVAAGAALAIGAAPALAAKRPNTVFVQTDGLAPTGNHIVAYSRAANGTLSQDASYSSGGFGGQLTGSEVDHLASQGSLAYDRAEHLLFAVNAGSDTVAVFGVYGNRLALRQDISSGGTFPSSIAVHDGLVYVLNAGEGGSLQGFAIQSGHLAAIAGDSTALNLPQEEPQFVHTPGQVVFSPSGDQLLVTTKAADEDIDVFSVGAGGALSAPVVNAEPGTVPFSIAWNHQGDAIVSEAGGFVADLQLEEDGTLVQLDSVPVEQAAVCWIVHAAGHFYSSNAGSASLTGFSSTEGGQLLTDLGNTETDGGTVDAAATPSGRYLYVQTGAEGHVDEFATGAGGTLTRIGTVPVPGAAGGEGIAAG